MSYTQLNLISWDESITLEMINKKSLCEPHFHSFYGHSLLSTYKIGLSSQTKIK